MSKDKEKTIRVRMAPSPTGYLHIGGARTTLFNYLFARQNKGKFILRIEDTDKERSKPEYEKDIIDGLKWLGLDWDEFYRQSERPDTYKKYLEKLLEEKRAYYCFCSEDELSAKKQDQMSRGEAPKYNGKCAELPDKEVKEMLAKGEEAVIRFKTLSKKVSFNDLVRGKVEFDAALLGDFVIAKDLNTPLYNFAAVVDDFEMEISHVIRGEEHISNTPKQILIQEALEFPQPAYAHIPLILGPDKSKLSKRHGAVPLTEYRRLGYLPEAVINFMAFLGWNPGDEREIFSLKSLVKEFSLSKIQKGGAVFNVQRLDYLNGFYIRQKSLDKLVEISVPFLVKAGLIKETGVEKETLKKIIALYQERLKKLSELPDLVSFFFKDKLDYGKELLRWKEMDGKELASSLDRLEKILSEIKENDFNKENLESQIMPEAEKFAKELSRVEDLSAEASAKADRGKLLWPLRVALTGQEASAGPFEIAEVLGKEKTLKRIQDAKLKI